MKVFSVFSPQLQESLEIFMNFPELHLEAQDLSVVQQELRPASYPLEECLQVLETSPAVGCGPNWWPNKPLAHFGTMLNQGNSKCIKMLHFQVVYPTVNLA